MWKFKTSVPQAKPRHERTVYRHVTAPDLLVFKLVLTANGMMHFFTASEFIMYHTFHTLTMSDLFSYYLVTCFSFSFMEVAYFLAIYLSHKPAECLTVHIVPNSHICMVINQLVRVSEQY